MKYVPDRGVKVALLGAVCVSAAVLAADVFVGTPPLNPEPGESVSIDLLVDVGSAVLGSYFFQFQYDPSVVTITSVGGGTTAEFSGAPATDPGSFASGTTPVAAAQGNVVSPAGFVSVATVTLQAVGLPADASNLDLLVEQLFDVELTSLPATVFPSSILIALPEAATDLTFVDPLTLVWTAVPDIALYDIYRGTLGPGGFSFDHTCFAADVPVPTVTDPEVVSAGAAFYYLVAAKRNGVDGSLGVTSGGQVRPNFLLCPSGVSSALLASGWEVAPVDGSLSSAGSVAGGRAAGAGAVEGPGGSLSGAVDSPGARVRAVLTTRVVLATQADRTTHGVRAVRAVRDEAPGPAGGGGTVLLFAGGDVSGDGVLDGRDAEAILSSLVGVRELSFEQEVAADVDGDGTVTVADAQLLRQFLSAGVSGRGLSRGASRRGMAVVLGGSDCGGVDLVAGLNAVRLRCLPAGYTAFQMLLELGGPSRVSGVQRFAPRLGRYLTARYVAGELTGEDFVIESVESHLVEMKEARRDFVAGRTESEAMRR